MSNQKEAMLAEMGIKPLWRLRSGAAEVPSASGQPEKSNELPLAQRAAPVVSLGGGASLGEATQASPDGITEDARPTLVLDESSPNVDWLFVTDGNVPLTSQAAKLLDAMLAAIGLKRGDNVFVAEAGQAFSAEQIKQIKPRLIVALGQGVAQRLLGGEHAAETSRGRLFSYQDVPLIVSEHPGDLLIYPDRKARVWEDLCFAQDQLA